MSNTPKNVPDFTCRVCTAVMCPDCKSLAAEYEYLLRERSFSLAVAHEKIQQLEREMSLKDSSLSLWKDSAMIGFPDQMRRWMESEVWIAATKPTAKERAKILKELSQSLRKSLLEGDHG